MGRLSLIVVLFLVGCAGAFVPKTFEDKLAYAEQSLAATTRVAAKVVLSKKSDGTYLISDEAAKCVRTGVQLAGTGLDQAKAYHAAGNEAGALKALDIAATGLDALATYLNGGTPTGACNLSAFGG